MATNVISAVFENFNELQDERSPPADEEASPQFDALGEIRKECWTEGYLTARREPAWWNDDQLLTAKLLTSLHELDQKTSLAVDTAALAVADLLIKIVTSLTSDGWSTRLSDRVRMLADRIKPALTVAPEFVLQDRQGTLQRFGDISDLSRAIESGSICDNVTIRWQRGEVTISRNVLLKNLLEIIIPISADEIHDQDERNKL